MITQPATPAAVAAATLFASAPARQLARLVALFAPVNTDLLVAVAGDAAATPVSVTLARWHERGLVHTILIPRPAGPPVGLHALSDLGLAALGLACDLEPAALALHARCGGAQLAIALAHAEETLAVAAALTMFFGVQDRLARDIVVERPWVSRAQAPDAGQGTLHLPAYVGASFGGARADSVILPDVAGRPPHTWLPELEAYVAQRKGGMLPPLLIVTSPGPRAAAWAATLAALDRRHGEESGWSGRAIAALVSPAGKLLVDGEESAEFWVPGRPAAVSAAPASLIPAAAPAAPPVVPGAAVPALVDAPLARAVRHLPGLRLVAPEWGLLDLYASHAALPEGLAVSLLGCRRRTVVQSRNRLVRLGLVRAIAAEEFADEARPEERAAVAAYLAAERPAEATRAGLALHAAHLGLTPATAAARLGVAGGGPGVDAAGVPVCVGPRMALVRQWRHTQMLYVMHAHLAQQAAWANARRDPDDGRGPDAVALWLPGAAVRHATLHPDAYVAYRRDGVVWPALLQAEHATADPRRYPGMLVAYREHLDVVRVRLGLPENPTVLYLGGNADHEALMAAAARAVLAPGGPVRLLLTTGYRVNASYHAGSGGLLGPVWRTPTDPTRRPWVAD